MSVGIGIFGIFFAIVFITVLAYKGFSTIWVAPIAAAIVAILGGLNLLDMYKTTFMQGFAGFVQSWFPAFMLGAIFGKLMECTNMAKSVALGISRLFGPKRAIIAAVVAGSILTLLAVCGMTHKDSYPDIAVCTIGMPMLSLIFGIILASLGVLF